MIAITLPWPPSALSPNTRQHWSKLAKAKKSYREACAWTAKEQGAGRIDAAKLHVSLVFVPPNRRAFDLDNLLSRMKSGLDGLCDVLGVDDKHWSLTISKADQIGGMVKVRITAGPKA
jgi:crossover junction endodeoxyribonuclease RusA